MPTCNTMLCMYISYSYIPGWVWYPCYYTSLRTSVNNKDIIQMHLGYKWLISQKTVPINASFGKQQAMASGYVHLSKLSLYNKQYQSMLLLGNSKQWLLVMFTYQSFLCIISSTNQCFFWETASHGFWLCSPTYQSFLCIINSIDDIFLSFYGFFLGWYQIYHTTNPFDVWLHWK